ncbi:neuronal pentraxin-1-like [Styela clava]
MIQNIPEIEELSVCAWLTPLPGKRLSGAVYSYFMSESFNGNGFLIFFNDNAPFNLEVYVNYEKRETLPTFENIFFYKSHICLLVSTKNNVVSLYVNGSFVMTEGFHVDKKPIRGNGKVILGQEQDQDEGGFQASQAFSGTIKNLIVWDHKISKKKIEHLYKTQCICPQDYVMVPTQNAVKIHGNVKANYITQC